MKSLNQAERKKAFGNFLLFFVITIAVIITVVFFSVQVPFRENKKMKEQVGVYKKDEEISKKFSADISNFQSLVDQLKNDNPQNATIQNQLASTLAELQQLKNSLKGSDTIYSASYNALNYLQTVKLGQINSESRLEELNKIQSENARLQGKLTEANTYISRLFNASGQTGLPPVFQ